MTSAMRTWRGAAVASLSGLAVVGLAGCRAAAESGVTETEQREIGAVTGVDVSAGIEATVTTGEPARAVVEADSAVLDRVEVDTDGDGTLRIDVDRGRPVASSRGVRVDVVLPARTRLAAVTVDDGASFATTEPLTAERVTIEADDASDVTMPVAADELVVQADGAATVELRGEAASADVTVHGASDAQLSELSLTDAVVQVSDGSRARVDVSGSLTAEAEDASTVEYVGEPERLDAEADGDSEIEPARSKPRPLVGLWCP